MDCRRREEVVINNISVSLGKNGVLLLNDIGNKLEKTPVDLFVEEIRKELFFVDGYAIYGALCGLFCADVINASSYLNGAIGARLRELEKKYPVEIVGIRFDKKTDTCFYSIESDNEIIEVKII